MTENMNALSITVLYPEENHNLLTPMKTVAEISAIQKPVMNVVNISTDPEDKEVYIQEKAKRAYNDKNGNYHPATPDKYALTKKALSKLMRAAGIKIKETKPILPATCQRCAEMNKLIGRPVNCYSCGCKDVAYSCTITVPQLTGESTDITAHKEINVADVTRSMSDKQKDEFIKFRNEMCESKAINRALRMALHVKPTYLLEELKRPFVVAYLVPNLDHEDVKREAIRHFFSAKNELFGNSEQGEMIESREIPVRGTDTLPIAEQTPQAINTMPCDTPALQSSQQVYDAPIEAEVYTSPQAHAQPRSNGATCEACGAKCSASVVDYSRKNFGRTLCVTCQRKER